MKKNRAIRRTGNYKKKGVAKSKRTWKSRQRGKKAPAAFRRNFEKCQPVHFCDIQYPPQNIPTWGAGSFETTSPLMFDAEQTFISNVVQQKTLSGVAVAYSSSNAINNAQNGKNVILGFQVRATLFGNGAVPAVSDYTLRETCVSPRDAGAWIASVENAASNAIPAFIQPFTPYGACKVIVDKYHVIGTGNGGTGGSNLGISSAKILKRYFKMHCVIQDQWSSGSTIPSATAAILPNLSYNGKGNKIWTIGADTDVVAAVQITMNIRLFWKNLGI
ncbi:capsid protein [Miresoil virus 429]|uniref:Capsid protein n=1 Tax=Miresoil virus 429 TaxID=2911461 RepID=A0A9E8YYT2_9VIRU|nr:capsid protein [Miresoil virus 429]